MEKGITELKELLLFVIEFGEALDQAMVDKKFEMAEIGLLIGPLMRAQSAFEGMGEIAGEIKDLSESESLELVEFIKEELDLEADKIELIVEKALELGVKLYGFISLFKKEDEVVVKGEEA